MITCSDVTYMYNVITNKFIYDDAHINLFCYSPKDTHVICVSDALLFAWDNLYIFMLAFYLTYFVCLSWYHSYIFNLNDFAFQID